ncbi:MAG: hypothetical protein C4530_17260 [Desulfobacteraceae bacterium]|nr:MAG: hypothetical protein C4530_17260 [Desulfobacteraceae bacterium]
MAPKVMEFRGLIFWFHTHDALHENRASVHVGKGSQDDQNDAKIWLEPSVEVSQPGRSLKKHELNRALKVMTTGIAGGLISPIRALLLAPLKGHN